MSDVRRLAAIDIGTVTTRLLIADVSESGIDEVARSTDITHLGQDLTTTGRLAPEAITRVRDTVERYAEQIRELGVERVSAVATSASRDAANGDELLAALGRLGVDVRIIDGEEEARLSFAGAAWSVTGEGLLVVDVGGGSTELIFGSSREGEGGAREASIEAMRSVDVGSRRITEMFLHGDPPSTAQLDEARGHIAAAVRPFFDGLRSRARTMVSLAGAATTFAAIDMDLAEYDSQAVHLCSLSGARLSDLVTMLARLPLEKRRHVIGLHPERAPVIVGGGLVLETVLALAGLDSTLVSEHDILYGILLGALRRSRGGERASTEG